jgi:hypothetical protein
MKGVLRRVSSDRSEASEFRNLTKVRRSADTPGMRCFLAAVVCFAVLVAPAAADTTVRGTIKGARGYTVNGTAANGQVVSAKVKASGAFTLRFTGRSARRATLHLIRPGGRYLGPVVLAAKRRKAFLSLSGRSAHLGAIRLRRGYAKALEVPRRAIGAATARADQRGRPLGAGRLGLVRSSIARSSQTGSGGGAGQDSDRDGVANAYDVDDDGDLTLDNVDSNARPSGAGLFSTLFLGAGEAINANSGATRAQIDAVVSGENRFNLIFYFDTGQFRGRSVTSAHVDCFALPYCRRGDGTALLTGVSESSPLLPRGSLWTDYTPDGSGYPNLERIDRGGSAAFVAGVQPRVTTRQIAPGDTFNVVFDGAGETTTVPTTLSSYFVTTPGVVSRSQSGEQVSFVFWRPQRAAIPGAEAGEFTDMGHLNYGVTIGGQGISGEFSCAGSYSGLSSTLREAGRELFPLRDSSADARPDPARTLGFTVDVGACLRAAGHATAGRSVMLTLTAASESRPGGQDRAGVLIDLTLP